MILLYVCRPTFINTESYHWPSSSTIRDYKFDAQWLSFYGLDKARVNIGKYHTRGGG